MINPFSNPSYLLPPLGALVVCLTLAALVWKGTQKSFSGRLFCGLLVSVGLWAFLLFGMRSSPNLHQALLWERAVPAATCATFVLYYHFTIAYTNTRGQKAILLASYLYLIIVATLGMTDLGIEGMRLEDYGYAPVLGPVGPVLMGYPLLMAGGAYNLIRRYRASPSYEERNRLLYLVVALLFPLVGISLDALSNLPPAAIWTNLIFCILCSIAILKYHLLDIRVVVRKSLVYLLVSSGIAIPYVSLLYLLHYIFEPKLGPWWIHALIILLFAIILRPLYSSAQQFVDRLFYRDRYDYLRALQRFRRQAQSVVNLKELSSTMTLLVSGALRASSVCLLLPSEGKGGFVVQSSTGLESPPSGVVLRDSSPLVKWLELHGDILSAEQLNVVPQLQSFSLKEKNNLERMGAKIYVPIKTHEGKLSGVLVLGQKLSEQSYSGEDKQLLTALTGQMGMALENARLYNASQRELEERKRAEEVLRQSEEKLHIAFESIADGIAVTDLELRITDVNEAELRMFGYSHKEEFIGRNGLDFISSKDHARAMEDMGRSLEEEQSSTLEYTFLANDGREFLAEYSVAVIRDESRNPAGFVSVMKDITERKRAEEKEKELQQQLYLSSRLASIGQLAGLPTR